mmetsp:Transcript_5911/g.9626  ORF Transcript_5911/g.9626 Transcript_5911/m.9626 type:complete len:111 (-) Transcript_5911:437-769(-)
MLRLSLGPRRSASPLLFVRRTRLAHFMLQPPNPLKASGTLVAARCTGVQIPLRLDWLNLRARRTNRELGSANIRHLVHWLREGRKGHFGRHLGFFQFSLFLRNFMAFGGQ